MWSGGAAWSSKRASRRGREGEGRRGKRARPQQAEREREGKPGWVGKKRVEGKRECGFRPVESLKVLEILVITKGFEWISNFNKV